MGEAEAASEAAPSELLYGVVALGMWAFVHAAFRTETVGVPFRLRHGALVVATHRADTDVPLICASAYTEGGVRGSLAKLHFAAREDLFAPGFFAGFPPRMHPALRRLLFGVSAARALPLVRVHPVPHPSAGQLRLARALAAVPPDLPAAEAVPPELWEPFRARARALGLPEPLRAGDVVRGEYADLLWRPVSRDELPGAAFDDVWRERLEEGREQVRRLLELVASGEPVLLFPEGRPSPDGRIGPLRAGIDLVGRRGRPRVVWPLAIAYDPLTGGRTRAVLAYGRPFAPSASLADEVLAALRRTMPLTCGQVLARALREAAASGRERVAAAELRTRLAAETDAARAERRPAERALAVEDCRRERLAVALRALERRQLVSLERGEVSFAPERLLASPGLERLANEHESARQTEADEAARGEVERSRRVATG